MNENLYQELFLFSTEKTYCLISNLRCLSCGLRQKYSFEMDDEQKESLINFCQPLFPCLRFKFLRKNGNWLVIITPYSFIRQKPFKMIRDNDGSDNYFFKYIFYVRILDIPFEIDHENIISHTFISSKKINAKSYLTELNKIPYLNFYYKVYRIIKV